MNAYAIRTESGPLSRRNQATAPTQVDAAGLARAFSRADFGVARWVVVDRFGGAAPYAVYQGGKLIKEAAS